MKIIKILMAVLISASFGYVHCGGYGSGGCDATITIENESGRQIEIIFHPIARCSLGTIMLKNHEIKSFTTQCGLQSMNIRSSHPSPIGTEGSPAPLPHTFGREDEQCGKSMWTVLTRKNRLILEKRNFVR